jgi:hypothetical protein
MERLKPRSAPSAEDILKMVDDRVNQVLISEQEQGMDYNQPQQQQIGGNFPATLTQENIEFLDGISDIPEHIRSRFWGITTVQNQLSQVNSQFEQRRLEAGSRMALQAFGWQAETDPAEIAQLEVYVRLQQLKSRGGIERRLLAPQLTEQTRRETVLEEASRKKGMIDQLLGR